MSERDDLATGRRNGAIGRRDFNAGAAALAAILAGGLPTRAAETPKKGGLLRLGLAGGSPADSLEPARYVDSAVIVAGRGLYNGLVELAADGRPAPELAASWEPRNNAADWVFTLRKGVKFSNGQEFTADDAIYSLNLHRGETRSAAAGAMKAVIEIKKLDKGQMQITLAAPDADFPLVLTDCRLMMAPDGFKDWSKPVGTGAFLLDHFEAGVRIALKKSGDYWKDGRGFLEAAEINVIADLSARLNGLIAHQLDIVNRVDPRAAVLLAKTPRTEIVRAASGWHAVLAMQIDKPPFANPDIRLALKYAVDRDQILKTLFSGYGALGNDHPIPPNDPYFNKDLPQRKRDPDKAAYHLRRSGLDPSIVLQTCDAEFAGAADMAALFQASAGKAGLKVSVKKEPDAGFWDSVWLKGAFVESYWAGRPAATAILSAAYAADAPLNESHWRNDRFEKLLADARSETDEARRRSAIFEMQALLHDDGGAVIPVFRDWIDAHYENVGGHTPHGGFELDNGYILDKAFIKA